MKRILIVWTMIVLFGLPMIGNPVVGKPTPSKASPYHCICYCGKLCDGVCVGYYLSPQCSAQQIIECMAGCCNAAPPATPQECSAY
jgi:hypothetical protein